MTGAAVVGAGWHDTYFRWDLSTPQRVVSRLEALPGQGTLKSPGRKLFAERDRFAKWKHLLGQRHVLIAYTVDSPKHGLIRRLELQAHLGDDGEDDLCRVEEFEGRWGRLQQRMGFMGVLPAEEPVYVRVDPAVDVTYVDPLQGQRVLEGLRYARWPRGWHAEYQGPPPYTTVAVKHKTKTVARATAGTRSSRTAVHAGERSASNGSSDSNGVTAARLRSSLASKPRRHTGARRSDWARRPGPSSALHGRFRR
jgi:hypothetical protein